MIELYEKLKQLFSKNKILYISLLLGILILISGGLFSTDTKEKNDVKENKNIYEVNDEKRLEQILENVDGAGKTRVMITYDTGIEKVTLQNSKVNKSANDKGASGGEKTEYEISEEKETVMSGSGSSQKPFVSKEINPRVRGVLVVAEGGGNEKVKYELTNAVAAVLDVPYYRIQVLKKKN